MLFSACFEFEPYNCVRARESGEMATADVNSSIECVRIKMLVRVSTLESA